MRTKPYLQAISSDAGAPNGRHYYEQACSLNKLSDDVIDMIVDYSMARTSPHSQVLIQHIHGAASCVSTTASAFALRDIPYVMNMVAAWNADEANEAEKHMEWVRNFQAAILPFTMRIEIDGKVNKDGAWFYPTPKDAAKEIKDYVAFWRGVKVEK